MVEIATTLSRHARFSFAALAAISLAFPLYAGPLDEMSIERWKQLREAERYQLQVAEKFYREHQYKVAADEYEKFLKLYEKSEGAPYSQLKWSHCQVHLRKQNAAIKDGYQSVLDYYPDSPEAPIAAMLIGRTYKDMGDTKLAKKAFGKAISTYPKHFAAVLARLELVEIAEKENDSATRVNLLRELTYDVERKGPASNPCVDAARQLARLSFHAGNFEEGLKALATTCKEEELPHHLMAHNHGHLPWILEWMTNGNADEMTKKNAEKLADASAGWLKTQAGNLLQNEKTKPRGVDCWYAIADIRGHARQPDKQKAVYEEMLKILGDSDPTLGRFANFFKSQGKFNEARAIMARFKDATEGQGQIAQSFVDEKKYDKAVEIYRKLALTDQKSAPKWLQAAAMAWRHGQKPDQAIAIYRELLTSDANNANEYHFQIAETLYYSHRWKDCIQAYRGTDRFPHNYWHMAAANRQLKQYDEAIALYQQIMGASAPNAPQALLEIGYTHEQADRKEAAIKTFKAVCDKFPKTGEGSRAAAHLNDKYKIPVTLGGAKD